MPLGLTGLFNNGEPHKVSDVSSPFPSMNPYLEHPALWPDDLAPRLAPRYYVGVEARVYALAFDEELFLARPDVAVWPGSDSGPRQTLPLAEVGVQMVEVPVAENYELRIDYTQAATPPLAEADAAWAATLIQQGPTAGG